MLIKVVSDLISKDSNQLYLLIDGWDDWYTFRTMYKLVYIDAEHTEHYIGNVKIGEIGLEDGRPSIPSEFHKLDEKFFSLGQDESYYEALKKLGDKIRTNVLNALNDIAFNKEYYDKAINETVTRESLMRSVANLSITGQYRRLAHGGAKLTNYRFTYRVNQEEPVNLTFKVRPESNPPTNIHALIGRNGVGKTHLINNMIKTILSNHEGYISNGDIIDEYSDVVENYSEVFANLVHVSFSAFDTTEILGSNEENRQDETNSLNKVKFSYVGLRKYSKKDKRIITKTSDELAQEFAKSAYSCNKLSKYRWIRAIEMLETDPLFQAYNFTELQDLEEREFRLEASRLFNQLSSGHKIVLLTTTKLVELVEEKSLVLIDEPEGHLHPPLLAAFTRALSDLLIARNGVSIIATHSPVILQEVPKSCVWILRSSITRILKAERPIIETFGENIGSLTREVFKLEVENSGFHRMLQETVDKSSDYEEVLEYFSGKLGSEAKAIVRSLLATKEE
ncbi:AAA family ATPase [Paenibacillus sp. BJ-4]|uniref:AAA family ATPase n=1 Tax=Paenibacillus sp. BJ-4 TaxID=2878097 RepID=UPI001CF0382F|nr:AAA family ATPase [Paenibacillus sp. BJ-4]